LVKDRCTLLGDFWEHGAFFFRAPKEWDTTAVKAKWNQSKTDFFHTYASALTSVSDWKAATLEALLKQLAEQASIKPGDLQLPLRIMLVGGKFGPPVFVIAETLGKEETILRIQSALPSFPG
jgi:glutamyl-tRNA synthetase